MTTWATLGEAFLERELKKERRGGARHYVLGQHRALVKEEGEHRVAFLSYVAPLGVVFVVLIEKGKYWLPVLDKVRVVGLSADYGLRPLPDDWELTDEMKKAIEEAERRCTDQTQ